MVGCSTGKNLNHTEIIFNASLCFPSSFGSSPLFHPINVVKVVPSFIAIPKPVGFAKVKIVIIPSCFMALSNTVTQPPTANSYVVFPVCQKQFQNTNAHGRIHTHTHTNTFGSHNQFWGKITILKIRFLR